MYQLSIFNSEMETIVHYPSSNQEDPHVKSLPLKEGISVVDTMSFTLYPNNQGYDKVFELTTKVKVVDLRDNTVRFTGRVLDVNNKMDSSGIVYKDVTCEGALSFLNDTKLRGSTIYGETVTSFLSQMLSIHNSKVESGKQIQVGTVNVSGNVIHTCEFKTTLAEIISVQETIGGQIRVREVNDILYMDWVQSFSSSILEVSLGINMKDMVISKDVTSLGTRIIPLGANNLTIESVNNGLDYIEDASAKALYGVIEKTVEYKDIEDASILITTCINDIQNHTQPLFILSSNALDLSFLTGNKAEQFVLGVNLHLLNRFMGVDATYMVVNVDLDLLSPYNPNLTISQKPITLSTAINDLRKSSIQNNGVYNNVQIGSSYGIRAVRSDNKVTTTINATDGISIENNTKKVFYVDINGNIVCVDLTANNITANGGTYNNIKVNQGIFTDITADGGMFDNITATNGIRIEDGDISCVVDANGITLTDANGKVAKIQILNDETNSGVYIPDDLHVNDYFRVGRAIVLDTDDLYLNNTWIQDYITDIVDAIINSKDLEAIIDDRIGVMVKQECINPPV